MNSARKGDEKIMKITTVICAALLLLVSVAFAGDSTDVKADAKKVEVKALADDSTDVKADTEKVEAKADTNETMKVKEPEVITTKSGLKYIDHVVGDGDEAVKGATVEVHYTGWLNEDGKKGKKFDSSKDRNQPFSFPLGGGRVIRGWDEGVAGMKVGGKRELIIPADLGYGARGAGTVIPPNATLIFDVELLKVVKN
jgi:peptidylprolyl isomerase